MKTNHLQKTLAGMVLAGLALAVLTAVAQDPPASHTVQTAVASSSVSQPFIANQTGTQSETNATLTFQNVKVEKPKPFWLSPFTVVTAKQNLKPVEGLDPRAWTTVVGWQPGKSAFPTAETDQSKLCLVWVY